MILLLGRSGYIGRAFEKRLIDKGICYRALSRKDVDYTNFDILDYILEEKSFGGGWGIQSLNKKIMPPTIINCAGYVGKPNVDACEENKDDCIQGNIIFPKMLSDLCSLHKRTLLHVSSGCIYNGYDKEFTEEDTPNFSFDSECSFYSGTKALAEKLIDKDNSYICRLRIPFDNINSSRNYISKLVNYEKLLDARNSISHREEFIDACLHLIENECDRGIYNITNTGSVTTRDVVSLIREHTDLLGDCSFFDSEEEFYTTKAKTPRSNCVLDNSKLLSTGFKIRDTQEALIDSLKNWRP